MSNVMELEYVVLTLDDLADVADLLVKHYYPRENLSVGVGLHPVDLPAGLESQDVLASLASGVSCGAREKTTKKLVAMLTGNIVTSLPKFTESAYSSDPAAKIFQLLEMSWRMADVFQDPGVERVLAMDRACVHPDYGGRGVLKEMLKKCMDLSTKQGCQFARLDATSPYTAKACTRLGFETRATIDLYTLEKGMFDLSLMANKEIKVMVMRLPAKN